MNYYNVKLGVERHWKSSSYVYSSKENLTAGDLVKVSFGKKKMTGYIDSTTSKPRFNVKPIDKILSVNITKETQNFIKWYSAYYGGQGGQAFSQLTPSYLTSPKEYSQEQSKFDSVPLLSKSQNEAMKKINKQNTSILHGITGSGKTRIYISLLSKAAKSGKNSLLLYPEISLTQQLLEEIGKYVKVVAFHSGLSNAQRSKLWFEVATSKEPTTVIGPRSALFLPHNNLGIVIIDEAHETSYKQDSDIRYNSLMVAGGLRKCHEARLVLGSATPPTSETTFVTRNSDLVCLHEKAIINDTKSTVKIINKKDKTKFRKHYLLSDDLLESIEVSLSQKKQSLLFLNKRGTAKLMICTDCDWQADCDKCDIPATYHHDSHSLICHTCNSKIPFYPTCPECKGSIKLSSFGGKAIEQEVGRLFPAARIGRFDSDNAKSESFSALYSKIKKGDIDILIGTQQLVKGLDLPLLRTVGILSADLSLNFPDYSSDERTFQLISQAAGRVGRGHSEGEVFIQTFQPNNPIIQLASREDWHEFYRLEMRNRKKYGFPPSLHLAKIIFRDKDPAKANKEAIITNNKIQSIGGIDIAGPIESIPYKRNNYYYVQLNLKSKSRKKLIEACGLAPKTALHELDPISLI